jgi:hypothetical protein
MRVVTGRVDIESDPHPILAQNASAQGGWPS